MKGVETAYCRLISHADARRIALRLFAATRGGDIARIVGAPQDDDILLMAYIQQCEDAAPVSLGRRDLMTRARRYLARGQGIAAATEGVTLVRELSDALSAVDWWEGAYEGRALTRADIVAELMDYRYLAKQAGQVYLDVTGGKITSLRAPAADVLACMEEMISTDMALALAER